MFYIATALASRNHIGITFHVRIVVVVSSGVNNVKFVPVAHFLNTKTSRLMKLHIHGALMHPARCQRPLWGWLGEAKFIYFASPERPTDIGLPLGKASCPCSR